MEKIMRREVQTYRVSAFRGNRLDYCRVIRIFLGADEETAGHEAVLKFSAVDGIKKLVISEERSEAILPLMDYEFFYHILQTEKPVYYTAFDEGGSLFCGVSTDCEPVGEGLWDND